MQQRTGRGKHMNTDQEKPSQAMKVEQDVKVTMRDGVRAAIDSNFVSALYKTRRQLLGKRFKASVS